MKTLIFNCILCTEVEHKYFKAERRLFYVSFKIHSSFGTYTHLKLQTSPLEGIEESISTVLQTGISCKSLGRTAKTNFNMVLM